MSDISDRVKKIVVEHLNVEEEKITDGASFIDDLKFQTMLLKISKVLVML